MDVVLYYIPILEFGKRNTIRFENKTDRSVFFDNVTNKLELETGNEWITNIWKLDNFITVFDEGRYPLANYNYVSVDMEHFYFIIDYEELGNNQIKYILRKDTLMSYTVSPFNPVNITSRKALVLREHKDRFDYINSKPIYDREIEEIGIVPEKVERLSTITPSRTRLVLRKYGGGAKDQEVLSRVKYFWDIYNETATTITPNINNYKQLSLGWGFGVSEPNQNLLFFTFDENGNEKIANINNPPSTIFCRIVKHGEKYILEVRNKSNGNLSNLSGIISYPSDMLELLEDGRYHLKNIKNDQQIILIGGSNHFEVFYDMGMKSSNFTPELVKIAFGKYNNSTWKIPTFDNIDQTDSINTKIIELPYFPNNLIGDGNNRLWGIQGISVSIPVLTNLKIADQSFNMFSKNFDLSKTDKNKVNYNDPKLYTSQFYPYFLTWYNESIPLKREKIASNSINFTFALNEADYSKVKISETTTYDKEEPYELTRTLSLNNEVATITSELDTYLRYLYDNDMKMIALQEKQANRSLAQSQVNSFLGIATGVVGGAIGGTMAGGAVGAVSGAVIGGVTATIKASVNLGFEISKHNNARNQRKVEYENKITAMQLSMINIAGGSPELNKLDNSDALKLWCIAPLTKHMDYLDEYFYKYGYQTLELKNPTLRTRRYFDYKEMIIDEITTDVVNEESKADIRERFSKGVTIYHYEIETSDLNGFIYYDTNQPFVIDYRLIDDIKNNIIKITIDDVEVDFEIKSQYLEIYFLNNELTISLISDQWNADDIYAFENREIKIYYTNLEKKDFEQIKENWEL